MNDEETTLEELVERAVRPILDKFKQTLASIVIRPRTPAEEALSP